MKHIYIFGLRLILGLVFAFGIRILFKPDMMINSVLIMTVLLVLAAYLLEFFRK